MLSKISDVPSVPKGYSWVGSSVSDTGGGLYLFVESAAEEEINERQKINLASFPKARLDKNASFLLAHVRQDSEKIFKLPDLDFTFPVFDLFPDGRILVAGTRCRWRSEDDFDRNGAIIDPSSGTMCRILLGDGIERMFVDAASRIWVSYFDEGVFGNFGWGSPGPEPVGASGLNCFDQDGKIIWRYPIEDGSGGISDCYALNISGTEACIYYYDDFPICRISGDFQRRFWKTTLRGCSHIALTEDRILFSGQYDDSRSTAYIANFRDGGLSNPRKVELILPDGTPIADGQLLGRGRAMHFFSAAGWFRIMVGEIGG